MVFKKTLIASLINACFLLNGCSKSVEDRNIENTTASTTENEKHIYQEKITTSYEFPHLPVEEFYEDTVVINTDEDYRKIRFNDFREGTKIIGGGLVHKIQSYEDGSETVIISTNPILNSGAGFYELLGSKANFNGNLALLVFDPKDKARVITNDSIAFQGILAPSDLYEYKNTSGEIEKIPIIYVNFYKSGNLTLPLIDQFLEKPKEMKTTESLEQKEYSNNTSSDNATPLFKDYPSKAAYTGKPSKLLLNNDTAKTFRTRLREALDQEPVFAGEYVLAVWGCGAGCRSYTFVNKRTGQVIEGSFGGEDGDEPEKFKLNSRLLVAHGIEYDNDYNEIGYHASFYLLENEKFKLIKKIPTEKPKSDDE